MTVSILDLIDRPYRGVRRPPIRRTPPQIRMARYTDVREDGCWVWTGGTGSTGYGLYTVTQVGYPTERIGAHRVSYELHIGRIPEGMHLDHLCRNRACVNPDHLEPVEIRENNARARASQWPLASVDTCRRGHDLTNPENVYVPPKRRNRRTCRACQRLAVGAYKARRALAENR